MIIECIFSSLLCVCVVFITWWQTGWVGTSTERCPASPPRPSTVLRRQVLYTLSLLYQLLQSLSLLPSLRLLKIRVAVHFRMIALHSSAIDKVFSIVGWLVFTSCTDHKVRKLGPSPLSSSLSFIFSSLFTSLFSLSPSLPLSPLSHLSRGELHILLQHSKSLSEFHSIVKDIEATLTDVLDSEEDMADRYLTHFADTGLGSYRNFHTCQKCSIGGGSERVIYILLSIIWFCRNCVSAIAGNIEMRKISKTSTTF